MSALTAKAIAAIGRGEVVIVTDDEDRENEGDLIMAADAVTTEALAFFLEHTSGVVCVALPGSRLDELDLPLMVSDNREGAAHRVHGDRRPRSRDHDGHLGRRPRADAPSARRSARRRRRLRPPRPHPAAAQPPGRRARARRAHGGGGRSRSARRAPARRRALARSSPPTGAPWRGVPSSRRSPSRMGCRWSASPSSGATACAPSGSSTRSPRRRCRRATARSPARRGGREIDGVDHLAFVKGDPGADEPVLVRVHSECLTGDVFGSRRCDCGSQLDDAMAAIADAGPRRHRLPARP